MTTVLNCIVKYPPARTFASQFGGDRQNIVAVDSQSREHTVWIDAGTYSCRKGDAITLIADDRGRITIASQLPSMAMSIASHAPVAPVVEEPEPVRAAPTIPPGDPSPRTFALSVVPPVPPSTAPAMFTAPLQLVQQRAALLRSCHAQIQGLFTDERGTVIIAPDAVQKYAVTLFIQICKEID